MRILFILTCLISDALASGGEISPYALDFTQLNLLWSLPFVGILLSLALCPIFMPKIWHHHAGKIAFFWALSTLVPIVLTQGIEVAAYEAFSTMIQHYIPFILLPLSLYVISGGLRITFSRQATPMLNTVFLCGASLMASLIGTTGAAMVFIRPFLQCNTHRQHKTHLVFFFILSVCNIGGCLTALGDPPLFLGFLQGVRFFWTLEHMFWPLLLVLTPLLILFLGVDMWMCRHEDDASSSKNEKFKVRIEGKVNILLLIGVIFAVLISGVWRCYESYECFNVNIPLETFYRNITLVILSGLSLLLTQKDIRKANHFSWEPIAEVSKIFAAIFIVASPVIGILSLGQDGDLGFIVNLVNPDGQPSNSLYFWITGLLSGFLDNAPTYMVFFHVAGGHAETLMTDLSPTLVAISAGSVFMGALTYIGNAPNFMVKSIAEMKGIPMPSFFHYFFLACCVLFPIFLWMSLIVF